MTCAFHVSKEQDHVDGNFKAAALISFLITFGFVITF